MFSEADGYEQFMGRWSRRLAPKFVEFAQVGRNDFVLDVGSGTGALSLAASAIASARVTGIERSAAYARYAQEHAEIEAVQFEVGDAMALPFSDNTFDRTLSMLVLNFARTGRRARSDDPSDAARRCRGGGGMGLRRRHGDAPHVLG